MYNIHAMSDIDRKPIKCCVVEDHHHIIAFLQACWRKKCLPLSDMVCIHYDSHPDMALLKYTKGEIEEEEEMVNNNDGSTVQQSRDSVWEEWFNMKDLVYKLEEAQGIAEFLLPICDNQYLSRVVWRKNEKWCFQFTDGMYEYNIVSNEGEGNDENEVCGRSDHSGNCSPSDVNETGVEPEPGIYVDLLHSYYLDEGDVLFPGEIRSTSHSQSMPHRARIGQNASNNNCGITLEVVSSLKSLNMHNPNGSEPIDAGGVIASDVEMLIQSKAPPDVHVANSQHWMLDICLDYFSTKNPFRLELGNLLYRLVEENCKRHVNTKHLQGKSTKDLDPALHHLLGNVVPTICGIFYLFKYRHPRYAHLDLLQPPACPSLERDPSSGYERDPTLTRNQQNKAYSMYVLREYMDNPTNPTCSEWLDEVLVSEEECKDMVLDLSMDVGDTQRPCKGKECLGLSPIARFKDLCTHGFLCPTSSSIDDHPSNTICGERFHFDQGIIDYIIKENSIFLLPHHENNPSEIVELILDWGVELATFCKMNSCYYRIPEVITIARSSPKPNLSAGEHATALGMEEMVGDFTPLHQVDFIQKCVLLTLEHLCDTIWFVGTSVSVEDLMSRLKPILEVELHRYLQNPASITLEVWSSQFKERDHTDNSCSNHIHKRCKVSSEKGYSRRNPPVDGLLLFDMFLTEEPYQYIYDALINKR